MAKMGCDWHFDDEYEELVGSRTNQKKRSPPSFESARNPRGVDFENEREPPEGGFSCGKDQGRRGRDSATPWACNECQRVPTTISKCESELHPARPSAATGDAIAWYPLFEVGPKRK